MIISDGLGATVPTSSIISSGIATVGGVVGAATATAAGTAAIGSALATIGLSATFVPFIGPIIGGIALAVAALGIGNGCGATCTATTNIVNQMEPYLKQNVEAAAQQAQANGGCLTKEEVATLEAVFNQVWNYVVQNCQQVGGPGGKQCVADRQRGGKWDWFVYYFDPIAQYPVCATTSPAGLTASLGLSNVSPLILGGAALLVVALLAGGD